MKKTSSRDLNTIMNILITGAKGFLGRNLSTHLRNSEHRLILADLLGSNDVTEIDVNQEHRRLAQLMTSVDVVIHAANLARINPSWENFESYYNTNISGSQRVFAVAQQKQVKKFIYISSSSVYGNIPGPQKETDIPIPTNPYGVSKLAAEHALRVQSQQGCTELIIVRPFCMYGEFMDRGSNALVLSKFLTAWVEGQSLVLDGGGQQTRDFIHASDAVKGLMTIIQHGTHGSTFNLGSGATTSIKQLADIISDKQTIGPSRIGNVTCTHADISMLRNLGFDPRVDVCEWLTNAVKDIKLKNRLQHKE